MVYFSITKWTTFQLYYTCEVVKIPANIVKQLFSGKEVSYTGKLYSPEHKQEFDAEHVKIAIAKNTKDNKPFLAFTDIDYGNWFRDQKNKMLEKLGINPNEQKKQQGQRR